LEGDLAKLKPGDDLEVGKPLHLLSNWQSFVKRYCYRRAQEDARIKTGFKENGKMADTKWILPGENGY